MPELRFLTRAEIVAGVIADTRRAGEILRGETVALLDRWAVGQATDQDLLDRIAEIVAESARYD